MKNIAAIVLVVVVCMMAGCKLQEATTPQPSTIPQPLEVRVVLESSLSAPAKVSAEPVTNGATSEASQPIGSPILMRTVRDEDERTWIFDETRGVYIEAYIERPIHERIAPPPATESEEAEGEAVSPAPEAEAGEEPNAAPPPTPETENGNGQPAGASPSTAVPEATAETRVTQR